MNEMNQKEVILDYLECAYSGAKMMDDVEMMCRLTRAIIAFDCDVFDRTPDWEEMWEEHLLKDMRIIQ